MESELSNDQWSSPNISMHEIMQGDLTCVSGISCPMSVLQQAGNVNMQVIVAAHVHIESAFADGPTVMRRS